MPFHAVPCRYLPLQAKPRPSDLRAFAKGQPEEAREGSECQPWVLEWLRWSSTRKQLRELEEAQGKSLGRATTELRLSLHLNVAAAALKQADHELAAGACQFVLRRSPEHPKALYRLAAAQRGGGDLKPALKTLAKLLALPGQGGNSEARQLVTAVREQIKGAENEKQTRLEEQQAREMVCNGV